MIKNTTKKIAELNELIVHARASESLKKLGGIDTSLIRPSAIFLVGQNKSQFRLNDDPDSDNWKDYLMKVEKNEITAHLLIFNNSGNVSSLKSGFLKMMTE